MADGTSWWHDGSFIMMITTTSYTHSKQIGTVVPGSTGYRHNTLTFSIEYAYELMSLIDLKDSKN